MQTAHPLADDPATTALRAAAQASLRQLADELVLARRAARLALDALPATTLAWLGPASEAFARATSVLRADVRGVRDPLVEAVAIVTGELA